jgi:hypothetical protein
MAPSRKTISIDALRDLLGADRTHELLERLEPPSPTVRVQLNELNLARVLFADPLTESRKWDSTVPVLRRYFLDRSQARRHFLEWIDRANADAPDTTAPPPPPARRRIVDPTTLEKRRAALAKARAARAEKRRHQKAS